MDHLEITLGGLLRCYYCNQRFKVSWEKSEGWNLDAVLMLKTVDISGSIVNAIKTLRLKVNKPTSGHQDAVYPIPLL